MGCEQVYGVYTFCAIQNSQFLGRLFAFNRRNLAEPDLETFRIDLDPANQFEGDGIPALGATGKRFFGQQRHFVGKTMFAMPDAVNPVLRNSQASLISHCTHN